jgi:hypothetical protein
LLGLGSTRILLAASCQQTALVHVVLSTCKAA